MYLLDTDVLIHLRDGDPQTHRRVGSLGEKVMMSIISWVELEGGVYRDARESAVRRERVDEMLSAITVVEFDAASVASYRSIVQTSGYSRRKVMDRMIASQALARGATLVTFNVADFLDVPDLRLEGW